jgi:hypothetical protein
MSRWAKSPFPRGRRRLSNAGAIPFRSVAKIGEVFVPGGLPSVTYVSRATYALEEKLRDYLDERHRILSLSGPTKSGKTVLVRRVIGEGVRLSGGDIRAVDDFWDAVADGLGIYLDESKERTKEESDATTWRVDVGVQAGVRAGGERSQTHGVGDVRRHVVGRSRSAERAAQEELRAKRIPVFVDDFHYISPTVQLGIVRGLKGLIFDGVPVILASVPHRTFDVVRVEKEMTGRVEQLAIPFWSDSELEGIAIQGFEALNVSADKHVVPRLARESFGSPHLMQDFCLQFCKHNEIRETAVSPRELNEPEWESFFRARAPAASKAAFDLLARTAPASR